MSTGATIIFAGGGTGGHLYPGLAIAEHLPPEVDRLFLCSTRDLDARILTDEGAPFRVIPAAPFGARPATLLRFVTRWGGAVRAARAQLARAKTKGPVHVVAMGGFVAAPVVQAARVERVPVTLVNLDAVPGRANRWIARHAGRAFSAVPVPGSGWDAIPPIVRRSALSPGTPAECRARLGLDPARPTLLVTGASQGAQSINRFMTRFVGLHSSEFREQGWQIVHQTGSQGLEDVREAYASLGVRARVEAYLNPMGPAWGSADLALSRAGAGSVAEAWANRVPTLFMPYPYHKDEHQRRNADVLRACGGAEVARDQIDPERNLTAIGPVLARLIGDQSVRAGMRESLAGLGPADGAGRVAGAILGSLPPS